MHYLNMAPSMWELEMHITMAHDFEWNNNLSSLSHERNEDDVNTYIIIWQAFS